MWRSTRTAPLLATCSTDKVVNVFERKSPRLGWKKLCDLKSHGGYITKVRFCHPFRGRILLTCSFDTKIHVFQEDLIDGYGWKRRAILNCNNAAVTDAQFCPYFVGPRAHQAGHVIVFEAPDPLNLTAWNTIYELHLGDFRISAITWDRNRFLDQPVLFVASDDPTAPSHLRAVLLEVNYNRQASNWTLEPNLLVRCAAFAPSSSPSYSRLAIATQSAIFVYAVVYEKPSPTSKFQLKKAPFLIGRLENEPMAVVSIKWNRQGSSLAVQYEDGKCAHLPANVQFRLEESGDRWNSRSPAALERPFWSSIERVVC
ncbi:Nucleoporin SEH1-like protein [Aphelenchoides fujianensis]|nr:Nucleoporin SEH1-like protein [Aphelenchoides fujianensis]